MKRTRPFFPVQPSSQITNDEKGIPIGYENKVIGGVSVRDMFALEIFCALVSNPALVNGAVSIDSLRRLSTEQADKLADELGEE